MSMRLSRLTRTPLTFTARFSNNWRLVRFVSRPGLCTLHSLFSFGPGDGSPMAMNVVLVVVVVVVVLQVVVIRFSKY